MSKQASAKARTPKSTTPAFVSAEQVATVATKEQVKAAPAPALAYDPAATLFVLSGKAHTAKQVATKQRPAKGHGAAWRSHAETAPSMRSQVMACLISTFGDGSFTIQQAVKALGDNAVPTGNRSHNAYGNLLVVRGYVLPADSAEEASNE